MATSPSLRRASRQGKAVIVDRLPDIPYVTEWAYPDHDGVRGDRFFKIEVRRERRRGSPRHIDDFFPCDYGGDRFRALIEAQLAASKVVEERLAGNGGRKQSVREVVRGIYTEWAIAGGLADSTRPGRLNLLESLVVSVYGDLPIDRLRVPEVRTLDRKLRLPQCPSCAKKQAIEDRAVQQERRRKTYFGDCGRRSDGARCGYGVSRNTAGQVQVAISSLLTVANQEGLIPVHPLHADPGFRLPRTGGRRRNTGRLPDSVERVRQVATAEEAFGLSLGTYEVMRPQEYLALMWRDLLTEEGEPRRRVNISKVIQRRRPIGTHVVEGVEVPLHVVPLLKGTDEYTPPWRLIREPWFWDAMGEEGQQLWELKGNPPLDGFVFLSASTGNSGRPHRSPGQWLQTHYRRLVPLAGLQYNHDESGGSLRRIGCSMLAIGPQWSHSEISDFAGNSPNVQANYYQDVFGPSADKYRGRSMDEIIEIARHTATAT